MFFVLKKKYDSLNFSHQHLRFEYERNLREIESLKGELLEIKQKEEDEKKFFSENLEKYNRFKNKVKEIEKMTINARCQYFINNYDLKVVEDNKSYKEFIDNDDATRWGKLNFSNYSSQIKKLRYQIYLYNPFLFNDIKTLNSITSGIEYYCGYPYEKMNIILRKLYDNSFDYKNIDYYKNLCNMLVFEFINTPFTSENIIAYRFLSSEFFLMILESFNKEGEYVELGFLSTSLLKNIQKNTQEHYRDFEYVLKIHVPQGNKAIYTSIISGREFEQELLFPNNSILKPLSKAYFDNKLNKIIIDVSYENYINIDFRK